MNSRTTGEASKSSFGVSPATGQPTTLRILSIPVWSVMSPTLFKRCQISGTLLMVNQRSWICCRVVISANPLPNSPLISASVRNWVAVVMPLGIRTRIIK